MTELTVTRTINAPPERIWRALTNADELAAWFWPGKWDVTATCDLRVGGTYRVASEVTGMAFGGEYVAVEPFVRLVQTWRWDGEPGETLVTTTLEPSAEGTMLTIVHERFATHDEATQHQQGWNDCLDRLPGHLGIHREARAAWFAKVAEERVRRADSRRD